MHRDLMPGNEFVDDEIPAEKSRGRRLLGYLAAVGLIEVATVTAEVATGHPDEAVLSAAGGAVIMIAFGTFAQRLLHTSHED
ncbi:MAG: hypothetical protein ACXWLH_02435 [Candidatus Saccharimonadales bacterium]